MIGLALLCAFTPADAVRDAVAEHEAVPVDDVEVGGLDVMVNAPAEAVWTVGLPASTGLCGAVPVVLSAGGHRYALRAPVTVWKNVPVASAAARPGDRVTLATSRVPCSALHGESPVDASTSWQANVALAAGDPVTTARVHKWPDVQKGASVRIEAIAGALTVTAPGQVLQDGYTGRKVSVLNLATRAVLSGTYAGNNVVTVQSQ